MMRAGSRLLQLLGGDHARTISRLGIHEEAERALLFLEAACRRHVATPELAEDVGRFLDRAANDRRLRFEPGVWG